MVNLLLYHSLHCLEKFLCPKAMIKFHYTNDYLLRRYCMVFSGGKLLDELKRLLKNFDDIEELKVNHLLLDLKDAPGVLEPIIYKCGKSISYLEIRNFTKVC